jgi:hypothetical protein
VVSGSGSARPPGSPEFVSDHIARSMPLSASERAWETRSWLAAITGSVCASAPNAIISVVRSSSVIIAIGSATPRWSWSRCITFIRKPPCGARVKLVVGPSCAR